MLKITKYNIPSVMLDNDIQMFNLLFKVIQKVDENAEIQVHKTLKAYKIIILPSKQVKKALVSEIEELSFILGDVFEFSKTLEFTQNITLFTK